MDISDILWLFVKIGIALAVVAVLVIIWLVPMITWYASGMIIADREMARALEAKELEEIEAEMEAENPGESQDPKKAL